MASQAHRQGRCIAVPAYVHVNTHMNTHTNTYKYVHIDIHVNTYKYKYT